VTRKFRSWRRRTQAVAVLVAALAFAGAAAAAWIIYTGGSGSAQGSFGSATQTNPAVLITDMGNSTPVSGPGGSGTVKVQATNNNPNSAETITSETDTFTSTPADCAAHLSTPPNSLVGTVLPIGGNAGGVSYQINADSSLPQDCVNGSYTLNISVTTSP